MLLKALEKLENLRLDRDIERGCGLVGDNEIRSTKQRERNHDALTHAPGQLMRIPRKAPLRLWEPNDIQYLQRTLTGIGHAHPPVLDENLT